jgi:hypothetical protein
MGGDTKAAIRSIIAAMGLASFLGGAIAFNSGEPHANHVPPIETALDASF